MIKMKIPTVIFVVSLVFNLSSTQDNTRMPPSIIRGPARSLIYRTGGSVTLVCKGTGAPDVKYEWKKNGLMLNQRLHNVHKGSDGTIRIQPATPTDEGFYQCFARNQYGTALSITAHVQRAFLDSPSTIPTVLHQLAILDEPFYIQCNPGSCFPRPTYGWEIARNTSDKNPIPLQPSGRFQIDENGNLHFAYALREDDLGGRIYRCITYNRYLGVKAEGNYTEIYTAINDPTQRDRGERTTKLTSPGYLPTTTQRQRKPESRSPEGFFSEAQTVAIIGRSVTLRCFFYNMNPVPKISWVGPNDKRFAGRYMLHNYNTTLTIDNITASDEGQYVCTGTSTRVFSRFTIGVRVEAEPMFSSVNDGPYDFNVPEGESFTFNCNPVAKPAATIVWFQDGTELDPYSPPERFVFSNNLKSLTILNVCRDCVDKERQTDLMVIQCNASNVHGYAFGQGYLNVLSPTAAGVGTHNWWIILLIVLVLLLVLFISIFCIRLQKKKRDKSGKITDTAKRVSGQGTEALGPHYAEIPVDFESAQATQQSKNDYSVLTKGDLGAPSPYAALLLMDGSRPIDNK